MKSNVQKKVPLFIIDRIKRELGRQRKALSKYRSGLGGMERQLNRLSGYRRTRQWKPKDLH